MNYDIHTILMSEMIGDKCGDIITKDYYCFNLKKYRISDDSVLCFRDPTYELCKSCTEKLERFMENSYYV